MSIGGPDPLDPPWRRLRQAFCLCPGWIGGAMTPVPPLQSRLRCQYRFLFVKCQRCLIYHKNNSIESIVLFSKSKLQVMKEILVN